MDKVTKKINTYKSVPITKNATVYIATDGEEFKTEKQCVAHEKYLYIQEKASNVKTIETKLHFDTPEKWWYANDNEELDLIKGWCGYDSKWDEVEVNDKPRKTGDLVIGNWIGYISDVGGDYPGIYRIYTLSYLKERVSELLNQYTDIL
jgi:hypothetical protein